MTWEELHKPYIGLHWWYRLLTGRKYTYPFIEKNGYWKALKSSPNNNRVIVECKFLNNITKLSFLLDRLKNKYYYKYNLYYRIKYRIK